MACRGVHFAITQEYVARLEAAPGDDARLLTLEEIEEKWDEQWLYQTDKAWDAIHRCLTDGKLEYDNGEYPYGLCILGGQLLYSKSDYIISLKNPAQVKDVALALSKINKNLFYQRYVNLAKDYGGDLSDGDFEYSWDWFKGLDSFFAKAAEATRYVVFTVDQ